ncbi:hypothetical protein [Brevundimonas sp.]|uniref:hypothetical protein n=1 Tax=Brevundimonas sp. TaxID=1871086 RepID=UPI00391A0FEA
MPQTVQIGLVAHLVDEALIHRLRNYGEDVYRYTRDGGKGMGEVDLEEVDSAKDQFSVRRVALPIALIAVPLVWLTLKWRARRNQKAARPKTVETDQP